MESFVTFLKKQEDFLALKPVDVGKIGKAEQALGLRFAREYADYVQAFGTATFGCHELTGICDFTRLNVVDVTLKQRQMNPDVPLNLYVVEECGMDDACIWQNEDGEVYCIVPGNSPQLIASSLLTYYEK